MSALDLPFCAPVGVGVSAGVGGAERCLRSCLVCDGGGGRERAGKGVDGNEDAEGVAPKAYRKDSDACFLASTGCRSNFGIDVSKE